MQTNGEKRWKLWVATAAMLPISDDLVYGKDAAKVIGWAGVAWVELGWAELS